MLSVTTAATLMLYLTKPASGRGGFRLNFARPGRAQPWRYEADGRRVVTLRLGVVFDTGGGALTEMMRSFRMGVGTWMGSGAQWLSWIHRVDVVRAILHLLDRHDARGPFNVVAPLPVTHREFCRVLSARKRTLINVGLPAGIMRFALGEMADELLLSGQSVTPTRLLDSGFDFRFASLDSALVDILGRG